MQRFRRHGLVEVNIIKWSYLIKYDFLLIGHAHKNKYNKSGYYEHNHYNKYNKIIKLKPNLSLLEIRDYHTYTYNWNS